MNSINQLNSLIRGSYNTIYYQNLDNATENLRKVYLEANLTRLGTNEWNKVRQGFTALAQEVDYWNMLILGTTPVLFNQNPEAEVENLVRNPADSQVELTTASYPTAEVTDGIVVGFDADTVTNVTFDEILLDNYGVTQTPEHKHRIVSSGGPSAILNMLDLTHQMHGPWANVSEYITAAGGGNGSILEDILPAVNVTNAAKNAIIADISTLQTKPTTEGIDTTPWEV